MEDRINKDINTAAGFSAAAVVSGLGSLTLITSDALAQLDPTNTSHIGVNLVAGMGGASLSAIFTWGAVKIGLRAVTQKDKK